MVRFDVMYYCILADHMNAFTRQVHVSPEDAGWVYFRGAYIGDEAVTPVSAVRSDTGRSLNVNYNLWIDRLEDEPYLQLIDYIDTAGVTFTYDIIVTISNRYSPRFEQSEFRVNMSEDATAGMIALLPNSTDEDQGQLVSYAMENTNADIALPFEINATSGVVRVLGQLDRELVDSYTFSVIASDDGTPVRTSVAAVLVSVLDINDNAPMFQSLLTDMDVEETANVGYELAMITATDPDDGDNGMVDIQLLNLRTVFDYNMTTARLNTADSLVGRAGYYVLFLSASDQGLPPRSTDLTITVNVVASNTFAPEFVQQQYNYTILEDAAMRTNIGEAFADDQDINSTISYSISEGVLVPFTIDAMTGDVYSTAMLDRETTANYTLHVLAIDNGAPPTGRKTGTADVTVTVGDVNDNAPTFPSSQLLTSSVEENSPKGTEVLRTIAVDADAGVNGEIAGYTLHPPSAAMSFAISMDGELAVIRTIQTLDAETIDSYQFHIVVADRGIPPLTTSALVRINVLDVNDNYPTFNVTDLEISLPRMTAANSLLTTFTASDADISDEHCKSNRNNHIKHTRE